LIDDGRTGLLFESGDEDALAKALARLIADQGLARRIGEAGRERVRARFDVRVMAETYDRHYRELLAHKRVIA
jgi:glycosyltransferase involved in cell wall biosynthesis